MRDGWHRRESRRTMRYRMRALGWTLLVVVPASALITGNDGPAELAAGPVVGGAIVAWQHWRKRSDPPGHLTSVEHVVPDDYHGPDAIGPHYMAWCDCGWDGHDHADEASARREAHEHSSSVRPGLNPWPT